MPDDSWRAYLREHSTLVRQQRLQSQAFVRGESLSVIPLEHASKRQLVGADITAFEGWANIDALPPLNYAAKFPPRSKTSVGCDIDVDCKPVDGDDAWTPDLERLAGETARAVINGLKAMGIDCRHHWGRASQDGWGHVYFPVLASSKEDFIRLQLLHMKRPLALGNGLKLRIEVRLSPDAKSPGLKTIMLPGSVHRARTGGGLDASIWRINPAQLGPDYTFPALEPVPVQKLVKGLYAGLLAAIVSPHWQESARHDMALLVAGVLASEVFDEEPILEEADAEAIMQYLCRAFADDDPRDRAMVLKNTLSKRSDGLLVTGYPRFAEDIGDDARDALIRLRGNSDPDQAAALHDAVAYVPFARGREDVYLNLSLPRSEAVICTTQAISRHFHPRPEFRARRVGNKELPLIEIVKNSPRLKRYHTAVELPGLAFRTPVVRDGFGYRAATPEEIVDPTTQLSINIGAGFATEYGVDIEDLAREWWFYLWRRHIQALTRGDAIAIAKLEKTIAWAVQHPLEKIPLGLAITGGGGIGKSALIDAILKPILGREVIAKINVSNLESQYRLANLDGKKFYVIEEADLSRTDNTIKELLKDLMKNPTIRVNAKYGREYDADNYAIPIFLTNESNPGLVIRGQRERSLALIQGVTQNSLGLDDAGWQAYKNRISDEIAEFAEMLQDQRLREAGMAYFMSAITVTRRDFEDNSDVGDVADRRDSLDPVDEALCTMLETNTLHPRMRGQDRMPLSSAFRSDLLVAGINEILQRRNRIKATGHAITRRCNELFGEGALDYVAFRAKDGSVQRVRYFTHKIGDLVDALERNLGIRLTLEYELEDHDRGENPKPDKDCCQTALEFDIENIRASNIKF